MSKAEILAELERLPLEDRIEVRDRLDAMIDARGWATSDTFLTPQMMMVLEERIQDLEKNPEEGSSWEEVEARIEAKLKKNREACRQKNS